MRSRRGSRLRLLLDPDGIRINCTSPAGTAGRALFIQVQVTPPGGRKNLLSLTPRTSLTEGVPASPVTPPRLVVPFQVGVGVALGAALVAARSTRFPLRPGGLPTPEGVDGMQRSIGRTPPHSEGFGQRANRDTPGAVFFDASANIPACGARRGLGDFEPVSSERTVGIALEIGRAHV